MRRAFRLGLLAAAISFMAGTTVAHAGEEDLRLRSPMDAFWAKDLAALDEALRRDDALDPSPHRALFADLLTLATCGPLEPLQTDAEDFELRALVRAEADRRATLAQLREQTVWADLLNSEFFRRQRRQPDPMGPNALRWPVEDERWTDELEVLPELRWSCGDPSPAGRSLTPEATFALAQRLKASKDPVRQRARHRLAWSELVRALRSGDTERAAAISKTLDLERLDEHLRFHARLAKKLSGTSTDSWADLAQSAPAALRPAIAERDCLEALATGKKPTAEVTSSSKPSALLALCVASAAAAKGSWSEVSQTLALAHDTVPREGLLHQSFRALTIQALALGPVDEGWRGLIATAGSQHAGADLAWAAVALALETKKSLQLDALAQTLAASGRPVDHARVKVLEAEQAFRAGDAVAFEAALRVLADEEETLFRGRRDRADRDRELVNLTERLLEAHRASPSQTSRALVRKAISEAELVVGGRPARALADAAERLEAEPEASSSLGTFVVPVTLALPAPAPLSVEWPEASSLLLIPRPDGRLVSWFGEVNDAS